MLVVVMFIIFKSLMEFGQSGIDVLYRSDTVAAKVMRALVQVCLRMLQLVNCAIDLRMSFSRMCVRHRCQAKRKNSRNSCGSQFIHDSLPCKIFVRREMPRTRQLYDAGMSCQESKGIYIERFCRPLRRRFPPPLRRAEENFHSCVMTLCRARKLRRNLSGAQGGKGTVAIIPIISSGAGGFIFNASGISLWR